MPLSVPTPDKPACSLGIVAKKFRYVGNRSRSSEWFPPRPKPILGRGSHGARRSNVPTICDSPTDWRRFPLSPRERVGVRGSNAPCPRPFQITLPPIRSREFTALVSLKRFHEPPIARHLPGGQLCYQKLLQRLARHIPIRRQ